MDTIGKLELAGYAIGGLIGLYLIYSLFNSPVVQGISASVSGAVAGLQQVATNAEQPTTLTNSLVTAALGPIGALYNIGTTVNQLKTYEATGVPPPEFASPIFP